MDFDFVLTRTENIVKQRKYKRSLVGHKLLITKEDAMEWFWSELEKIA